MFAEIRPVARRLRRATSTSTSTRRTCTTRASWTTRSSRLTDAGPRLRAGRRDLAAHDRLRRRQGPRADQDRRRAGPTSPPTAPTTWTSGSAASTGSSIMLGADHHGYVGRLPGAGRVPSATTRTRTSRSCIGQLVNLVQDGEPLRMSKRAGTVGHPGGPGRGDRRRRRPVRPGPLLDRLADRPRPRRCGPGTPATTRSSTCSTRTPGWPACCATPPSSASTRGDAATPSCSTTSARATCSGRSASSRGWSRPRPSCASRTGSRATSRSWPAPTTGSTTPAGCCRAATRSRPTCTGPGSGWSRRPASCSPTACGCSASARPSGCTTRCAPTPPGRGHGELRPRGACTAGRPTTSTRSTRPSGRSA